MSKTQHPLHDVILARFALHPGLEIKAMFGGLCFMLNGNMCCGLIKQKLMARVGAENYERFLAYDWVEEMDFTGKPLRGFVFVDADFLLEDEAVQQQVLATCENFCLSLPPKASKAKV